MILLILVVILYISLDSYNRPSALRMFDPCFISVVVGVLNASYMTFAGRNILLLPEIYVA